MLLTLLGASFAPPLDLAWTGFWRANYSGSPWPGTPSAGSSAGRDLSEAISPPVGGTPQNGYTPADFGGVSSILRTADPAEGVYIGATTCTIHAVVKVRSAPAPGANVFDDPCLIVTQNSATLALGFSSSGVAFGVYTSGGPVQTAYVPLTGGYDVIQARLDGTNASVRVNGGAWSSVAATDFASDPTNVLLVGSDYTGAAQFFDALALELGIAALAFGDTSLDASRTAAVTRYALGAAPQVVAGAGLRALRRGGAAGATLASVLASVGRAADRPRGAAPSTTSTTAPGAAGAPRGRLGASPTATASSMVGAGLSEGGPLGAAGLALGGLTVAPSAPRPSPRTGAAGVGAPVVLTAGAGRMELRVGAASPSAAASVPGAGLRPSMGVGSSPTTTSLVLPGLGSRWTTRTGSSPISPGGVTAPGGAAPRSTAFGAGLPLAGGLTMLGVGLGPSGRVGAEGVVLGTITQVAVGAGLGPSRALGAAPVVAGGVTIPGAGLDTSRTGAGLPSASATASGASGAPRGRLGAAPATSGATTAPSGLAAARGRGAAGLAGAVATLGAGHPRARAQGAAPTLAGGLVVVGRGLAALGRVGGLAPIVDYAAAGSGFRAARALGAAPALVGGAVVVAGALGAPRAFGSAGALAGGLEVAGVGLALVTRTGAAFVSVGSATTPASVAVVVAPLAHVAAVVRPLASLEVAHRPLATIGVTHMDHRYQVGDEVTIEATFRVTATNALADPSTLAADVYPPNGAPSYVVSYPSGTFTRLGLGVFALAIDATTSGTWRYRIRGTGAAKAAHQGSFVVEPLPGATT